MSALVEAAAAAAAASVAESGAAVAFTAPFKKKQKKLFR